MIHKGKVVLSAPLDAIKARHRRVTIRFDEPRDRAPELPGALGCQGGGREWTVVCDGALEELQATVAGLGAKVLAAETPSLEDIFVARVGAGRRGLRED